MSKFGRLETMLNHMVLKSECIFSSAECNVHSVKFTDVFFMFKLPLIIFCLHVYVIYMNIHLSTDLPGGKVPYTCVRFFPLESKGAINYSY